MSRYETLLNGVVTSTIGSANPATYVAKGYGQVEPNHLSAQRTGQIYAQLPAAAAINVLQQGQFVKYDYAANEDGLGEVNFTGEGEWMLVFNEIKLYREGQNDCEFAMVRDDYNARIYSPFGENKPEFQSRYYNGLDAEGNAAYEMRPAVAATYEEATTYDATASYFTESDGVYTAATVADATAFAAGTFYTLKTPAVPAEVYPYDKVTTPANDMYELFQTDDPFNHIVRDYKEKKMHSGTKMVPRVFKTNVGDIFTTNTIALADQETLAVGNKLYVGDKGFLCKTKKTSADTNGAVSGDMVWQVVKVYTMPDNQPGVKIMRIA